MLLAHLQVSILMHYKCIAPWPVVSRSVVKFMKKEQRTSELEQIQRVMVAPVKWVWASGKQNARSKRRRWSMRKMVASQSVILPTSHPAFRCFVVFVLKWVLSSGGRRLSGPRWILLRSLLVGHFWIVKGHVNLVSNTWKWPHVNAATG